MFWDSSRHAAPDPSRRWPLLYDWRMTAGLSLMLVATGLVWSDRQPADPSTQRPLQGQTAHPVAARLPAQFRLATFNIHSGKGSDGTRRLSATADVLQPFVDVAFLQEVRGPDWWGHTSQAEQLATLWQSHWMFLPTERRYGLDHFGSALLSRVEVTARSHVPMVCTTGRGFRHASLLTFRLFDGTPLRVIATHLDVRTDRVAQLREVTELFRALQAPCVLLGDLNTGASDPLMQQLLAQPDVVDAHAVATPRDVGETQNTADSTTAPGMLTARTKPVDPVEHGVDWMLVRGLRVLSADVLRNTASDHPALVATLELAPVHVAEVPLAAARQTPVAECPSDDSSLPAGLRLVPVSASSPVVLESP